ncbi:MAG TPA: YceI family protein [Gemmatimonadaceae bacterium]|nr:YceI family protein [Gemmatimonadaceae bacterium]
MANAQSSTATSVATWQIDPAHTGVEFAVKHMMISTVKGRFTHVSGTIRLDESNPARSSVEATIDATSIDTRVEQRDAHLRSADFLDADRFPSITFRSTRVVPRGEGRAEVTGDLVIHGVTRQITLEVEEQGRLKDPYGNDRVGFSATGKLDRRDFGLTWNQTLEAGGLLVGNEVRISIEVEATRSAS